MTPAQLRDLFRSDVRDEVAPYLWSDPEVYSYMDDAQKMLCRESGGIADSTSSICVVPVRAGDTYLVFDPRILKLRDVRRMSDGRNVRVLNFADLGHPNTVPDDYGQYANLDIGGAKFSTVPAPITGIITGMDGDQFRLSAPALEDDELRLIVYRLPIYDVSANSTELEVDSYHHRHLLSWMKHLAHEKQDAETYDRGRSSEFRSQFLAYCDQVKAERERREHKHRTVVYGGI
jgi:hypothetical protein